MHYIPKVRHGGLHPSQFKRLIETLRSKLDSIQEALREQEHASREAAKAADEKWREVPGILASSVLGTAEEKKTAETHNQKYENQQDSLVRSQNKLVFWTRLAFVAAAVYAGIAAYQGRLMHVTYKEIQGQTGAARDSAYAACLNAQAARQAFLQERQTAVDAHSASVAGYTQAIAAVEGQKAFVTIEAAQPQALPFGELMTWVISIKNIGKSDASNVSVNGWAVVAPPNSHPKKPLHKDSYINVEVGTLRPGEQFLPEVDPYTGQPIKGRKLHVPVSGGAGEKLSNTAEVSRDLFLTRKRFLFVYFKISFDDFFAHYERSGCNQWFSWDDKEQPKAMTGDEIDKECSGYGSQARILKTPMPPPFDTSKDLKIPPEIECVVPKQSSR